MSKQLWLVFWLFGFLVCTGFMVTDAIGQTVTLTPDPLIIKPVATGIMTATLSGPAPVADLKLNLSCSAPTLVDIPENLFICAGGTSAAFEVTAVAGEGNGVISVTDGGTLNDSAEVVVTSDSSSTTTTTSCGYPVAVPRTGQTKCYNTAGDNITCNGTGQDGEIQAGVPWPDPRFTDRGDGTVTDNLTGLVWLQNANLLGTDDEDNDTDGVIDGAVTWQHALDYIKRLNRLNYLGYNNWRLPNVNELESLVDAQLYNPGLPQNYTFFFMTTGGYLPWDRFWSSTSNAINTSNAWLVGMYDGFANSTSNKTLYRYVWPVRSGQSCLLDIYAICLPKTGQTKCYSEAGDNITCNGTGQDGDIQAGVAWPSPRFVDHGDNTTTDNLTALMWTKNANLLGTVDDDNDTDDAPGDGLVTWQHALDYIKRLNRLNYLGYNNWRLPNRRELRSLADYAQFNPALPQDYPFTNIQSSYYWSSTSSVSNTTFAWTVDMARGSVTGGNKTAYNYVWPVRSEPTTIPDDYGNTCQTASSVSIGTYVHGSIEMAGDVDYFWFYGNMGLDLSIFTTGDTDTYGALLDNSCSTPLDSDDDSGGGNNFLINHTLMTNGTYYIEVRHALSSGTGVYILYIDSAPLTTTTIASTTTTTAAASTTTTTTAAASTTTTTTAAASTTTTTTAVSTTTTTTTVGATTTTTIFSGSSTTTSVNAATTTTTTTGGGKPCPARQVLGDDNPKLEQIRDFRDSSLAQSAIGRKIIQIYYNNADSINAALERSPALRAATRKVLEIIAPMVGRKEE